MAGSQDIFDSIVMADERFHAEGYREGYEEGSSLGVTEGRQHGTLHGAKIGSEIGCYQGFAFAWKCLLHSCTTEKDSGKKRMRRYGRRDERPICPVAAAGPPFTGIIHQCWRQGYHPHFAEILRTSPVVTGTGPAGEEPGVKDSASCPSRRD
ncbi:PREDICTED: oral cancer-overexpressed protein 1 isoform X2 [Rhinopithecus bieti]|uniref:oral cancer-overexpressed protein 1 isoform X2 n=1 Tax=Rhinopithecus bieti TaxID=61621 RepID=UPI00083C5D09|nr:PREDICTED: oral cancer-overexpressed protein 1 isoform X2 [Rhinopithecus bieti]